jgi:hypothetical protein
MVRSENKVKIQILWDTITYDRAILGISPFLGGMVMAYKNYIIMDNFRTFLIIFKIHKNNYQEFDHQNKNFKFIEFKYLRDETL